MGCRSFGQCELWLFKDLWVDEEALFLLLLEYDKWLNLSLVHLQLLLEAECMSGSLHHLTLSGRSVSVRMWVRVDAFNLKANKLVIDHL